LGIGLIGRVRWEIVLALYLVPTLIYVLMMVKEKFPKSEAAAAGVKFLDMVKEFAAPMLLFLLVLHVCIGYVELGTDSWIVNIMDTVLGGKGLFILLYTSILMFVLRFFAGPIVHRINPLGLLFVSAVVAAIGLYSLGSLATKAGPVMEKAKDFSITLPPDEQAVRDASFHGGQTALRITAAIPVFMALGFLYLIIHFRRAGGYKQIELTSQQET
ncbi:MAG: MFS transporter, partial [Acidobacteriota bacterium]|nr:MFS transporter [Acidobacteriota bacterium]